MALDWQKTPLLLGSQSPRRAQLLRELGLEFRQAKADLDEVYPPELKAAEIACFLAEAKAKALAKERRPGEVLICSDTVVWCNGQSLEKAANKDEAIKMLKALSGQKHEVITGVSFWSDERQSTLYDTCIVEIRELEDAEMHYYIDHYQPFDKAGAYGIQEWLGLAAIRSIEGSYFTVMGLPTHLIVDYLRGIR